MIKLVVFKEYLLFETAIAIGARFWPAHFLLLCLLEVAGVGLALLHQLFFVDLAIFCL